MITNDDLTLQVLNGLLMVSRDAEKGYQEAADVVTDPALVELFEEYALQRGKFALELRERITALRATPSDTGTPFAGLHRAWMDLKAALETRESRALLTECERGDALALKGYAAALREQDIDGQSRDLIQRQYELVQAAHDRIRQLRERLELAGGSMP